MQCWMFNLHFIFCGALKSPTGPWLLLNLTALHCSAGCQPTHTTKDCTRCGGGWVWCQKLPGFVPRNPGSPLTWKVIHCLLGGEWALLNYCYSPNNKQSMVLSKPNGMSFSHFMITKSQSVHRPNQVSDWTLTLAWLDCTAGNLF